MSELAAALLSIWVLLTPQEKPGAWAWTIVSAASSKERCEEIRQHRVDRLWTICARLGAPPKAEAPADDEQGNDGETG